MTDVRLMPYDAAVHGDGPWRVVSEVFAEYGFPFDENDYDRDLLEPYLYYGAGDFVVADQDGEVVGCVGVTDEGGGLFELHRLYVLARARGRGTGRSLVEWVVGRARELGGERLVLFSDVHFTAAHRLYERLGFRQFCFRYAPDPWQSREWGYILDLR